MIAEPSHQRTRSLQQSVVFGFVLGLLMGVTITHIANGVGVDTVGSKLTGTSDYFNLKSEQSIDVWEKAPKNSSLAFTSLTHMHYLEACPFDSTAMFPNKVPGVNDITLMYQPQIHTGYNYPPLRIPHDKAYIKLPKQAGVLLPGWQGTEQNTKLFLLADTCNGLTGQHYSIALLISYAISLKDEHGFDPTVVIPPLHLRMDYADYNGVYKYMDHTTHFGVLYDIKKFIDAMEDLYNINIVADLPNSVTTVAQVPTFARFIRSGSRLNGAVSYRDYTRVWKSVYERYEAVQFPCLWQFMEVPANFVELRDKMIHSLVPSSVVTDSIGALVAKYPKIVAVHARTEGDWLHYCPGRTIEPTCYISSHMIARILLNNLEPRSTIYILTGSSASINTLKELLSPHGHTVISKKDWNAVLPGDFEKLTEYLAVMDQQVALTADIFWASYTSSFSKMIFSTREREGKISYKLNSFLESGYYPFDGSKYVAQFDGDASI